MRWGEYWGGVLGLSWGAFIMLGVIVDNYVDNFGGIVDNHVISVDNFRCHIGSFYR